MFELHDQGSDAVLARYSIFADGEVFVLIDGDRRKVQRVVDALNESSENALRELQRLGQEMEKD